MSVLGGWLKTVASTGRSVAVRVLARTNAVDPTPGAGETVVNLQQVEVVAFASVLVTSVVAFSAGQRVADGAAEVVVTANPKRVGLRIRVKMGPVYMAAVDTVGPDGLAGGTPGMIAVATESFTLDGYTGPLFAADDGQHAVDLRVWEWSTP